MEEQTQLESRVRPVLASLRRAEENVMQARMLVKQGAWIPALDLISDARVALSIQANNLNTYAIEEMQKAPELPGVQEANG